MPRVKEKGARMPRAKEKAARASLSYFPLKARVKTRTEKVRKTKAIRVASAYVFTQENVTFCYWQNVPNRALRAKEKVARGSTRQC